jgi:hypothetical protein
LFAEIPLEIIYLGIDALRSVSKGIRKNIEKWVPGVFMPD